MPDGGASAAEAKPLMSNKVAKANRAAALRIVEGVMGIVCILKVCVSVGLEQIAADNLVDERTHAAPETVRTRTVVGK